MKYGQISDAPQRNATIYKCFESLCEADQKKFVKEFAKQPHEGGQVMDTFQELVLGTFMLKRGLPVRYVMNVDGKTPDWCLNYPDVEGLVEIASFHASDATQKDVRRQIQEKGAASWWMEPNTDRLYSSIQNKASIYKEIVERREIPYVIGVFPDFLIDLEPDEVNPCLYGEDSGLFKLYHSLSGVVFFVERGGGYFFQYLPNPEAAKPFNFPEGLMDLNVKL